MVCTVADYHVLYVYQFLKIPENKRGKEVQVEYKTILVAYM